MSEIELVGLICLLLIVMILVRIPVGVSLFICGMLGIQTVTGSYLATISVVGATTERYLTSQTVFMIPLFVLSGQFALHCGLSSALFKIATAILGRVKGGVAMATILISVFLSIIGGGSTASNALTGQVALRGMKEYGYSDDLVTGTVAAGSSLGLPAILFIYASLTQQNLGNLLFAARVPIALAIIGYFVAIAIYVRLNPASLGTNDGKINVTASEIIYDLLVRVLPFVLIFLVMLGGVYVGFLTPVESITVAAVLSGLAAVTIGGVRWHSFKNILLETARSSGRILFILLGAAVFSRFTEFAQVLRTTVDLIASLNLNPYLLLIAVLAVYLVLGCFLDPLSTVAVTAPIFFPMMAALNFDMPPEAFAAWYSILVITTLGVGGNTPPIGMNMFIINALSKDVPLNATYRGVVPFLMTDFIRLGLLIAFPFLTIGWLS